jgi:hypothetical protein
MCRFVDFQILKMYICNGTVKGSINNNPNRGNNHLKYA